MITVIGGIKGGSGKTTLATNLVVMHAGLNKKVLLIDADDQRSASDWSHQRKSSGINTSWETVRLTGSSVRKQLQDIQEEFDEIIIDTGGRDTTSQRAALTVADILIAPFQPRSLDIWTLGQLSSLIKEVLKLNDRLKVFAVINRADPKGKDNEAALNLIKDYDHIVCIPTTVGQRKSFANASTEGLGVVESKPKDKKAISEIKKLYQSIYGAKKASKISLKSTNRTS